MELATRWRRVTGVVACLAATALITPAASAQEQVDELVVDLGSNTGQFMGGASGSLYGVYGDGVPTRNLIEGIKLRTLPTKAQDGTQHPGADALEVVRPLADASGGDVYIYMTDIYRGFPYEWPGDTPEARLNDFKAKIAKQVDQVKTLPEKYRKHIVFVPFNEPEGNMFGTGEWSYNKISWLDDPQYYFQAWDDVYALIKGKLPNARIAGPNTSELYEEIQGFLSHTIEAGTVPDVMTWHELSDPGTIRSNVDKYRTWEQRIFQGTPLEGKRLPININEYAHRYHISVPGQLIQWVSAIEDSKVDADLAYWNIDGNISDSAVQANRANGQWWLLNAYSQMTGHTVRVTPPEPNVSYTLQGVAAYDQNKAQARSLFGGSTGPARVRFTAVDENVFGQTAHALVREIPWSGQIGDSPAPRTVAELTVPVRNGEVNLDFGERLPGLRESSAYEVILTPGEQAAPGTPPTVRWERSYEAENAEYTGDGYSKNGPEGSPENLDKFYTSGQYDVGGLRTGSNGELSFDVEVPENGTYDLSVFANSLNTYELVRQQGPTNVFLRVDGGAEQELFLPLGYQWAVWDHTDTTVRLTKGTHRISLAAQSLDGSRATQGDAIIDKIDLSLPHPKGKVTSYEAEHASLAGTTPDYTRGDISGSGVTPVPQGSSATFWVYSPVDGAARLAVDAAGNGQARLRVNDQDVATVDGTATYPAFLRGGVNKVTVEGTQGELAVDRLSVESTPEALPSQVYEAEEARTSGEATVADYSLAKGGRAVTGIGGDRNNANTLAFDVQAPAAGTYMLTVRYSNPEQSEATHYNPDPLARHADVSVNGQFERRMLFPHSFHANNFWELSVPVNLAAGDNTVSFYAEELPNFDGTYASEVHPNILLRSKFAPNIDNIRITPVAGESR